VLVSIANRIYPLGWMRQSQVRHNEFVDTILAGISSHGRVDATSLSDLVNREIYGGAGPLDVIWEIP